MATTTKELTADYVRNERDTVEARWEQGKLVKEATDAGLLDEFAKAVHRNPDYLREWRKLHESYAMDELVPGASAKAHVRWVQGGKPAAELAEFVRDNGGAADVDEVLKALNLALATKPEIKRAAAVLRKATKEAKPEEVAEVAEVVKDVIQAPEVADAVYSDTRARKSIDAAEEKHYTRANRAKGIKTVERSPADDATVVALAHQGTYAALRGDLAKARKALNAAIDRIRDTDFVPSAAEQADLAEYLDGLHVREETLRSRVSGGDWDTQLKALSNSNQ